MHYPELITAGYDPHLDAEGFYFDVDAADMACDFFAECLVHTKGEWAGEAFILDDWQLPIIRNMFGWKDDDGCRRYREVFIYVPRKNGKTALISGIVLYVLFCDDEPGAEIYSAAADREQAALVYHSAKAMRDAHTDMRTRSKVYTAVKRIVHEDGVSFYAVLSRDAHTKHGLNAHLAVVDELHTQPDGELVEVLETSQGARRQPLFVSITTADFDRPSVCNEKLDYAKKVRDGVIDDPGFLPIIYEASREDDWMDEAVWHRVNPGLGKAPKLSWFRAKAKKAKQNRSFENTFKRLNLNICTEQDRRWISLEDWDGCDGQPKYEGPCFGGLDLSSTTDIAAFVLLFPETGNSVKVRMWLPEATVEKERHYKPWVDAGLIETTPGDVIDYEFIRKRVNEDCDEYDVQSIGYDPWNATQLAMQLYENDGRPLIEFRQGFVSMNEPTKKLEGQIVSGDIRHGGHLVLRWMAANCAVKEDSNENVKVDKQKSSGKIDGIVGLIMATGLASQPPATSVYENRGVLTI